MPFDVTEFMGGSLTHTDLHAPHQVWTMESVAKRTYDEGTPKAKTKVIVKFAEHGKPLGLNVTNVGRIAVLYGTDADGWVGKQLKVYRTSCDFKGKPTLCIRVCGPNEPITDVLCHASGGVATAPEQAQQSQSQQQGPVEAEAWEG